MANLARPGGNITGLTATAGLEVYGKQFQFLKDAFPRISRVAILVNQANYIFLARGLKEAEAAARALPLRRQVARSSKSEIRASSTPFSPR